MSKVRRIGSFIFGILMMLLGAMLVIAPVSDGLSMVAALLSVSMTIRGFQSLIYYFRMARFSVGGRASLYRGIIYLEIGAMTSAMSENPAVYIALYLAILHMFNGAVNVLRGNEARGVGSPQWRFTMAFGVTDLLIATAIIVSGLVMHKLNITVYVYAAGLVYSGILRIAAAFRRTAIVYIQ